MKLALVHPKSNVLIKILSEIEEMKGFNSDEYPTAYKKVDVTTMDPVPTVGQIWNGVKFEDSIQSTPKPDLTDMQKEQAYKIYQYAKTRIDNFYSRYSHIEMMEWETLYVECEKYINDNDDVGPILTTKRDLGNVDIYSLAYRTVEQINEYHSWMGEISEWRSNSILDIMSLSNVKDVKLYNYIDTFPKEPDI